MSNRPFDLPEEVYVAVDEDTDRVVVLQTVRDHETNVILADLAVLVSLTKRDFERAANDFGIPLFAKPKLIKFDELKRKCNKAGIKYVCNGITVAKFDAVLN